MLKIFSQLKPSFTPRIIYMLQASEYDTHAFIKWFIQSEYKQEKPFRQKLKPTLKSKTLYSALILTQIAWLYLLFKLFTQPSSSGNPFGFPSFLLTLTGLLLTPYLLLFTLIALNFVGKFLIQAPVEKLLIYQAQKKLTNHPGIKIAVLGSYGKTTMKELLKTVLGSQRKVSATPGNLNTPLGIRRFIKTLSGQEEILIFEFGEYYPKDIDTLAKLTKPDYAILTGINEAHLEKFKTLENTIATFLEITPYLPEKNLLVNANSQLAKIHAPKASILYSGEKIADFKIQNPKTDLTGVSFTLKNPTSSYEIHSKLLGLHQIGPLSAVFYLATKLGLDPNQTQNAISQTQSFSHRLEPKTTRAGTILIDDSYNGNPDGALAAMNFLKTLSSHNRIYVTPGLVELGDSTQEIHLKLGKHLASCADTVILIKTSATPFIEDGLKANHFSGKILHFDSMSDFLSQLENITTSKDVVLIQNDWPDNYL